MKKLISLLVALTMIFALATLLTSCYMPDSNKAPDSSEGDTTDTEKTPADDNKGEEDEKDETEDKEEDKKDEEATVRTTVTPEEWSAAFAMTNFTINATLEMKGLDNEGNEKTMSSTGYLKCAPPIHEEKSPFSDSVSYFTTIDGNSYKIQLDGDGFVAYPDNGTHDFTFGGDMPMEDFSYDAEKGAYCQTTDSGYAEIYFENGVIKKMCGTSGSIDSILSIFTYEFTDIGTTEIELPEYTFHVPSPTVTDAEWNYYRYLSNYTVTEKGKVTTTYGDQTQEKVVDRVISIGYDTASFKNENGEFEYYALKNDFWNKIVNYGTENVYEETSRTYEDKYLECYFKDNYVFDEEKGAYTYEDVIHYYGEMPVKPYFYFSDGKLDKIVLVADLHDEISGVAVSLEGEIVITVTDIDTTEVEIPKIRSTVTEEEFNALAASTNYTAIATTGTEKQNADGEFIEGYSETHYILSTDEAYKSGIYSSSHFDMWMLIDGEWYVVDNPDADESMVYLDPDYKHDTLGDAMMLKYSDLTYDEEEGCYFAHRSSETINADFYIYFEAGKLAKIDFSSTIVNDDGTVTTISMMATFSDIGTTEFYIPEIKESARKTVTEEEWDAHFNYDKFVCETRFTVELYDADNNLLYSEREATTVVQTATEVLELDGNYDVVSRTYLLDGVWYEAYGDEEPVETTDPTILLGELMAFETNTDEGVLSFDDLIYIEESGAYYSENACVLMGDLIFAVYMEFEDGVISTIELTSFSEVTEDGTTYVQCSTITYTIFGVD